MKTLFSMLSAMALLAFISIPDLSFTVKVEGAEQENVLANGLRVSQLTELTIDSNDERVEVLGFEIIHARGKSPVNRDVVTQGNTFDLDIFRDQAKPGDRIVIHVTKITGDNDKLSNQNSILEITIR